MVLLGEHYYLEFFSGRYWIAINLFRAQRNIPSLAQCLAKSASSGLRSWRVHGKRLWAGCDEVEGCCWYSKGKSDEKVK